MPEAPVSVADRDGCAWRAGIMPTMIARRIAHAMRLASSTRGDRDTLARVRGMATGAWRATPAGPVYLSAHGAGPGGVAYIVGDVTWLTKSAGQVAAYGVGQRLRVNPNIGL